LCFSSFAIIKIINELKYIYKIFGAEKKNKTIKNKYSTIKEEKTPNVKNINDFKNGSTLPINFEK
jgi:hypothetical protein